MIKPGDMVTSDHGISLRCGIDHSERPRRGLVVALDKGELLFVVAAVDTDFEPDAGEPIRDLMVLSKSGFGWIYTDFVNPV